MAFLDSIEKNEPPFRFERQGSPLSFKAFTASASLSRRALRSVFFTTPSRRRKLNDVFLCDEASAFLFLGSLSPGRKCLFWWRLRLPYPVFCHPVCHSQILLSVHVQFHAITGSIRPKQEKNWLTVTRWFQRVRCWGFVCVMRMSMHTWVCFALHTRSTRTSYDQRRNFQISKSNIIARISLGVTFLNGHNFGPSMTHEM
jgi:hypothetical protein